MAKELIEGLHENLWGDLRQIFNTDRIMLGVAYLVNFSAFILLLVLLPDKITAALISLVCLFLLNGLLFLSLRNSKQEVLSTIQTLIVMYEDNQLKKYFNESKVTYYENRYKLWLVLVPGLMLFAVIIAVAIKYAT